MSDLKHLMLHDSCLIDAYVKTNADVLDQSLHCDGYRRVDRIELLSGGQGLGTRILYRFQVDFGMRCAVTGSDEYSGTEHDGKPSEAGLRILASFQLDYVTDELTPNKVLHVFAKQHVLPNASVLWKDWVALVLLRLPLSSEQQREIDRSMGVDVFSLNALETGIDVF